MVAIGASFRGTLATFLTAALIASSPVVVVADLGDCSQPVTTGAGPTATDCLYILRAAVGTRTCSPECICAPKGTLPTKATDALLCLRKAVGQDVTLSCPCEPPDPPVADNFDDNSKNSTRWGDDYNDGNGQLKETSQVLQYTCASATDDDSAIRPWIASLLPYGSDWSVQVDVENLTVATKDDQVSSYGLTVVDASNYDNEAFLEIYMSRFMGPPVRNGFYGELDKNLMLVADVDSGDLGVTSGAVRISWSGTSKVLTLSYDENADDGRQWVTLGTFGVAGSGGANGNTNWGMGSGDSFAVGVYGYSSEMVVNAGLMSGDDFRLTGGVEP